jgi:hypothetical protein
VYAALRPSLAYHCDQAIFNAIDVALDALDFETACELLKRV